MSCLIHSTTFYRPKPEGICCMALHPQNKKLALSRADASIEIWNFANSPYIERTIASSIENFNIEGLAWCQDRLFSVGLHGLLIEYDLVQLEIIHKAAVTGEAAYCLDIHVKKEQIAIGTEQGYLNVFDVTEDGAVFNKFLDKQEGRILCLKYDHSGSYVISGGLDAIRVWNIEEGYAIHRMTTGRSETNKPTIIWCLAVAEDLTIVSGDSRGKLTVWDGKIGAQVESYQSHRADIMALCLSEDQKSVYCSGVDSTIVNFVKIQMKGGKYKWVRGMHKKIHDHDVRTLVLQGDRLLSGGTCAYLAMSYNNLKISVQYPPILQNPCVTLCKKARLMMLRYQKYIEVWSLGETDDDHMSEKMIPLTKLPKKHLLIQRISPNHNEEDKKEGIIFSTMSDDGKWIAYGTSKEVRVFQYNNDEEDNPKLFRVENSDDSNLIAHRGVFTPDSSQLIIALREGCIAIYDVLIDRLSISQRLECKDITDTITFLLISSDGKYLVAADPTSNIVVWLRNKNKSWSIDSKLPSYSCPPTSLAMNPTSSHILVVYADNRIIEYSIKDKCFTDLWKNLRKSLPESWYKRVCFIRNIFYMPRSGHIVFHDDNVMMSVHPKGGAATPESKKKKTKTNAPLVQYEFNIVKKFKHLVHMELLSDNEVVAVKMDPLRLLQQLPPAFVRNKFGTK